MKHPVCMSGKQKIMHSMQFNAFSGGQPLDPLFLLLLPPQSKDPGYATELLLYYLEHCFQISVFLNLTNAAKIKVLWQILKFLNHQGTELSFNFWFMLNLFVLGFKVGKLFQVLKVVLW